MKCALPEPLGAGPFLLSLVLSGLTTVLRARCISGFLLRFTSIKTGFARFPLVNCDIPDTNEVKRVSNMKDTHLLCKSLCASM